MSTDVQAAKWLTQRLTNKWIDAELIRELLYVELDKKHVPQLKTIAKWLQTNPGEKLWLRIFEHLDYWHADAGTTEQKILQRLIRCGDNFALQTRLYRQLARLYLTKSPRIMQFDWYCKCAGQKFQLILPERNNLPEPYADYIYSEDLDTIVAEVVQATSDEYRSYEYGQNHYTSEWEISFVSKKVYDRYQQDVIKYGQQ